MGEFFLSQPNIAPPARLHLQRQRGQPRPLDEGIRSWAAWIKSEDKPWACPYGHRYVGSLVADAHRTLLKGGIFAYPPTRRAPAASSGSSTRPTPSLSLRAAGGRATTGADRILDIVPRGLHDRTPLVLGSKDDVAAFGQFARGER